MRVGAPEIIGLIPALLHDLDCALVGDERCIQTISCCRGAAFPPRGRAPRPDDMNDREQIGALLRYHDLTQTRLPKDAVNSLKIIARREDKSFRRRGLFNHLECPVTVCGGHDGLRIDVVTDRPCQGVPSALVKARFNLLHLPPQVKTNAKGRFPRQRSSREWFVGKHLEDTRAPAFSNLLEQACPSS